MDQLTREEVQAMIDSKIDSVCTTADLKIASLEARILALYDRLEQEKIERDRWNQAWATKSTPLVELEKKVVEVNNSVPSVQAKQ